MKNLNLSEFDEICISSIVEDDFANDVCLCYSIQDNKVKLFHSRNIEQKQELLGLIQSLVKSNIFFDEGDKLEFQHLYCEKHHWFVVQSIKFSVNEENKKINAFVNIGIAERHIPVAKKRK